MSAEILSIHNDLTLKYLLEEVVFIEEEIDQMIQIQKQIQDDSSDRSYSSIKSNQSIKSNKDVYQLKSYQQADKENFVVRKQGDLGLNQIKLQQNQNIAEEGHIEDFDIGQQDFPDVKKTKTIKKTQVIKKKIKKPLEPLVFKLLDYFKNKKIIHILDGYVSKALQNMINNKLTSFLSIIKKYNRFNDLKRIISHIQSSSVEQFLLNLITKSSQLLQNQQIMQQIAFFQFIQRMTQIQVNSWPLNESILSQKVNVINLYSLIIDRSINRLKDNILKAKDSQQMKRQLGIFVKIINKGHIGKIIQIIRQIIVHNDHHYLMPNVMLRYMKLLKSTLNVYCQLKGLWRRGELEKHKMDNIVKQLIQTNEDVFDRFIHYGVGYIFQNILVVDVLSIQRYKPYHLLTNKLQCLDIIALLIKESIYFSKKTFIDCYQFPRIFELFKVYQKSSIFHNALIKLIIPFFKEDIQHDILNEIFTKKQLFEFLYQSIKEDCQIKFERKEKNRRCYINQIILVCKQIQKLKRQQCSALTQYKKSEQWQFINEWISQDEKSMKQQLLAGHQKLAIKKSIICFSKQQCLTLFRPFLQGLKYNGFDQFDNYEPENTDSQDEGESKKLSKKSISYEEQQQNEEARLLRGQIQKLNQTQGQTQSSINQINDQKYFNQNQNL